MPDQKFICWTVLEHPASNTGMLIVVRDLAPCILGGSSGFLA